MKKVYQKPSIKIKEIETESPLATSGDGKGGISVGGNTGIGIGEGNPPAHGTAKGYGFFDSEDDPSTPSNIWN